MVDFIVPNTPSQSGGIVASSQPSPGGGDVEPRRVVDSSQPHPLYEPSQVERHYENDSEERSYGASYLRDLLPAYRGVPPPVKSTVVVDEHVPSSPNSRQGVELDGVKVLVAGTRFADHIPQQERGRTNGRHARRSSGESHSLPSPRSEHVTGDLEDETQSKPMPEVTEMSSLSVSKIIQCEAKTLRKAHDVEDEEGDGDLGEMSMDFTRAGGGIQGHEGDGVRDAASQDNDEDFADPAADHSANLVGSPPGTKATHGNAEEPASQKENAAPSITSTTMAPSPSPLQAPLRDGVAAQSISRDDSTYPSSSPAVAMNLLAGRSPNKRPPSARWTTEPPSSGDFRDDLLLPRAGGAGRDDGMLHEPDHEAPPTSTPALPGAAPPNPPRTAERTQSFSNFPDPIAGPSRSRASSRKSSPSKPRALYQSSAAMRNRAPMRPKRRKDPMDDTQETPDDDDDVEEKDKSSELGDFEDQTRAPDDSRSLEPSQDDWMGEKDMTIDVTMVAGRHDHHLGEEEEKKPEETDPEDDAMTPRPSAMARVTTLLSSSDEADFSSALDQATLNELPRASVRFDDSKRDPSSRVAAHIISQGLDQPASSGTSAASSQDLDAGGKSLGLSEIAAMSSQPVPSQFEMQPTQMYDIERLGPPSFSRDSGRADRSIPSFEYETTESSIRAKPPPVHRALRRIPPPPTPSALRALLEQSSSLGSHDPQDPTQVHQSLSSPGVTASGEYDGDLTTSSPGLTGVSPAEASSEKNFKSLGEAITPQSHSHSQSEAPERQPCVLVPASEGPTQPEASAAMDVDVPVVESESAVSSSRDACARPITTTSKGKGKGKARMGPRETGEKEQASPDPIDTLPRKRARRPSAKVMAMNEAAEFAPVPPSATPPLPALISSSSLSSVPPSCSVSPVMKMSTTPVVEVGPRQAKARKGPTSPSAKKAPTARSKKATVSAYKRKTTRTSTLTAVEQPVAPVAGPSSLRFEDHQVVLTAEASTSRTESVAPSRLADVKPRLPKSKLPATAPFTRVFGLWRDDLWLYPATAIDVSGGRVHVVFDDGSKGKLKFSELRRPELQRGDWIRYRGDETLESETQVSALARDVRVYRVESEVDGDDVRGPCGRDDVVATASANVPLEEQPTYAAQDRLQRLLVCAIAIPPQHTVQFDNRRLTAVEIAGFEGKPPVVAKAPTLLSIPPADKVDPVVVNRKDGAGALFSRMGFFVTSTKAEAEKRALLDSLRTHGATVLEVDHLFSIETGLKGGETKIDFQLEALKEIDTILLLADQSRMSPKFLVALALGIPCVSPMFVSDSIELSARREWKQYAISPGLVQSLHASSVYAQFRAMSRPSFGAASLAQGYQEGYGVFHGRSFLFVLAKPQIRSVLSIVVAAGARSFHVVGSTETAAASAVGYDHVVLEDGTKLPHALRDHVGVGSMTWMKQCLIAGRLLPPEMIRPLQNEGN